MQTFLPYLSFEASARVLDYRRLGKQRVETKQILMALSGESKGWVNHPAVKMWRGHEFALSYYGLTMCEEWKRRGYNDTLTSFFTEKINTLTAADLAGTDLPSWLGDTEFHRSHQSNLIRKDPIFYSGKFPGVPDNLPYIWPEEKVLATL